jgi:hypothetical protein
MNDGPADLTITRQAIPGQIEFIRIEARDGLKVLARLDMSPADFLAAVMGETVIAAYSRPGAAMEHPIW